MEMKRAVRFFNTVHLIAGGMINNLSCTNSILESLHDHTQCMYYFHYKNIWRISKVINYYYIVFVGTNTCNPNPCSHGRCNVRRTGYICQCNNFYHGVNCDQGK